MTTRWLRAYYVPLTIYRLLLLFTAYYVPLTMYLAHGGLVLRCGDVRQHAQYIVGRLLPEGYVVIVGL